MVGHIEGTDTMDFALSSFRHGTIVSKTFGKILTYFHTLGRIRPLAHFHAPAYLNKPPFPSPFEYIYSPSHGPVVDDRTNPVGQSQVSEMSLQNITLLMPVLHWISLQESRRENMLAICT